MSKKPKEKTEPVTETQVYIGPDIRNVAKKNTFLTNGLTEGIKGLLEEIPRTADLIVPLSKLTEALQELKEKDSPRSLSFRYVQKNAKGRR